MQPEVDRGHLQRIRVARVGQREVALLEVRVPGETLHLVCAAGLGVALLDAEGRGRVRETMRGAPVAPAQARWRARFEGGQIRAGARALELTHEGRAETVGTRRDDTFSISDGLLADADLAPRDVLQARGATLVDALCRAGTSDRRDALRRALGKALARIGRRVTAVEGDLARTETADELARGAQLFVASAAAAPRGASRLEAVDWSSGESRAIQMPIDPARGAREQIDALFKRARRLKEGARIARARLADARAAHAGLMAALATLAAPDADLGAVEDRARAAAPRDFKAIAEPAQRDATGTGARHPPGRLPYRTFVGASGAPILVGRGAADNDALSLHVARPHDLWLHAKEHAGAHVIVALDRGASCPPDLLVEAAHLAAHFSDARDEAIVDVQYTPRRYVRKPRGSPPGLVVVEREKVMVLRRDERTLRRLLEGEK